MSNEIKVETLTLRTSKGVVSGRGKRLRVELVIMGID